MSADDGVQITSGGVVAVDTDSLRHAAERFHGVARQLDAVSGSLRRECARLQDAAGSWGWGIPGGMLVVGDSARVLAESADGLGVKLAHAAGVYEVVELRIAMTQATSAGDTQAAERAKARLDALTAADPGIAAEADRATTAYGDRIADEDRRIGGDGIRFPMVGDLAGAAGGAAIALAGRGRMLPGMTGPPPPGSGCARSGPPSADARRPTLPTSSPASLTETRASVRSCASSGTRWRTARSGSSSM